MGTTSSENFGKLALYPRGAGFFDLLRWHFRWGTHPELDPDKVGTPWTADSFSTASYKLGTVAASVEPKTIDGWLNDNNRPYPKNLETIVAVLFRDSLAYEAWRMEFRRAYAEIAARGRARQGASTTSAEEIQRRLVGGNPPQSDQSSIAATAEQDTVVIIDKLAKHFVGRSSDIEAIDNFVKARMNRGSQGLMVITAPPGIGKSALAAHWCKHAGLAPHRHIVRHFCSMSNGAEQTRPEVIYEHLHKQIADYYGEPIGSARHLDALTNLLCRAPPDGRELVVWLDGIDEANGTVDCFVPYASGLEKTLADRVCVIVSARAEPKIIPAYLDPWLESNRAKTHTPKRHNLEKLLQVDVEALIEKLFKANELTAPKGLAPRIFRASEGGWPLFVRNMIDSSIKDIREGREIDLGESPESLQGYIKVELARLANLTDWRDLHPIFVFLTIAKQAVTRTDLEVILGKEIFPENFPSQLTRWLNVAEVPSGRINHMLSFAHPLLAKTFGRQVEDRQKTAEKALAKVIAPLSYADWPEYASRHMPRHLLEMGCIDNAVSYLTDIKFITARFATLSTDDCLTAMKADWMAWYGIEKTVPQTTGDIRYDPIRHLRFWSNYSAKLADAVREGFDKSWLQLMHDVGLADISTATSLISPKQHALPESIIALSGHQGQIYNVLVLPDRSGFLSCSEDGTLRLWDVAGAESKVLSGHEGQVYGALILPDGAGFVSWSHDRTLRLWGAAGEAGKILRGHNHIVAGALILPDDAGILSWAWDCTLRQWGYIGQKCQVLRGHELEINGALVLADHAGFLSWSGDGTLRLWSKTSKKCVVLHGHKDRVLGVLLLSNNGGFLSWSVDGTLRLWGLAGEEIEVLRGHTGRVSGALILPDGAGYLSWSDDNTLRLWDAAGAERKVLRGHESQVLGALLSMDGSRILSWSIDGTLRLWGIAGEEIAAMHGHEDVVRGALILPDGAGFLSWSGDGTLRIWGTAGENGPTLRGHDAGVLGARLLPGQTGFMSWSNDRTLRIWSIAGQEGSMSYHDEDFFTNVRLLPEGKGFLSRRRDGALCLWSSRGEKIAELLGHKDWVTDAVPLPNGVGFLSWSKDGTLRLWSAVGKEVAVLRGHEDVVYGAHILSDGAGFLSWSCDRTLRLWDVAGKEITALYGHEDVVRGALILPNGAGFLSWSYDRTLRLWDAAGKEVAELRGHEAAVYGALILPDDAGFLSWGNDETLRLWSPAGEELAALHGHVFSVNGALILPDGAGFLSWGEDGTLRLWGTAGEERAALGRHRAAVRRALLLPDSAGCLSWSQDGTLCLWSLVGKEVAVLRDDGDAINGALVLPDDSGFLSWSENGTIRVWDISGEPRNLWLSPSGGIRDIKLCETPDRYLVAFGNHVGIIHLPFSY